MWHRAGSNSAQGPVTRPHAQEEPTRIAGLRASARPRATSGGAARQMLTMPLATFTAVGGRRRSKVAEQTGLETTDDHNVR